MHTAAALLVTLSLAQATPTVAVLPLAADKGVSKKEAARVDKAVREALSRSEAFLRPLPATRHDKKDRERCRLDAKCLSDLAFSRGADLLAGGVLVPEAGGLTARVVVASPKSGDAPLREVDEPLGADKEAQELALDRLLRRAFAPEALAGGVQVHGAPDGATVLVDGKIAGELPLDEPIFGVVEGEHEVTVRRDGYGRITRRVQVRFREVTDVEIVLTPRSRTSMAAPEAAAVEAGPALPVGPLVVGGAGVAALAGGAAFGVGALMSQLEVERRAAKQQLVFPRDANLVRNGETLSWVANGLYLGATLAVVGAGAWWLTEQILSDKPERETYLAPPVEGAPEEGDEFPRRRLE